jgi:hypothetical protein
MKRTTLEQVIEEQRASNRSARAHRDHFASHRQRLSERVLGIATTSAAPRLCVLGAGGCNDLELAGLSERFAEVHLVDLDRDALERARDREAAGVRGRLQLHTLDLSGLHAELPAWQELRATPEALMQSVSAGPRRIADVLPGPFDVVVSACLLSQLQLALRSVLSEGHQLFEAARQIQNLVHLRSVARLTAAGGRALLVSDLASDLNAPLQELAPDADLPALALELTLQKNVIYAVSPALIALTVREDPYLSRNLELAPLSDAWLWHNGPERTFLVYALDFLRR